jgi:hypothetical protein
MTAQCKECQEPLVRNGGFQPNGPQQEYCSTKCRKAWNNRRMTRGAKVYDVAIQWRRFRKKEDFSQLCELVDWFIREDKRVGRTHTFKKPFVPISERYGVMSVMDRTADRTAKPAVINRRFQR